VVHRIPLRYEAPLWSVVFPLGMYGVGGQYLGQADHLPIVESIGSAESWIALAVWAVTSIAMLHHLVTTISFGAATSRRRPVAEPSNDRGDDLSRPAAPIT
jgi:tellurite resistance protein TehA-like permease